MGFQDVMDSISFPVEKVPVYIKQGQEFVPGVGCNIVRTDTNKAISVVSSTYGLIPHAESLKPVLQAIDGLGFDVKRSYIDHEGKKVMVKAVSKNRWAIGNLPSGKEDVVRMTLFFINSYDRTTSLNIKIAGEREVCTNGMTIDHPAFKGLNLNLKVVHSQNQVKKLDVVALGNSVAKLYAAMEKQAETWRNLKAQEVKKAALEAFKEKVLAPVVGERNVDKVADLSFNGKGQDGRLTLWALYNGVTQHYSEKAEESKTPVSAHGNLNRKALDFLTRMNGWVAENPEQLVTVGI